MPFLSDVLGDSPIPAGKLAYFRARLSNSLHELVLNKFMEREKNSGFSRAELARKIGKRPEQLTRWLGAPGNWTLDTVSDLLLGMGLELKPEIADLSSHQERRVAEQELIHSMTAEQLELEALSALDSNRAIFDTGDYGGEVHFPPNYRIYMFAFPSYNSLQAYGSQQGAIGNTMMSALGQSVPTLAGEQLQLGQRVIPPSFSGAVNDLNINSGQLMGGV